MLRFASETGINPQRCELHVAQLCLKSLYQRMLYNYEGHLFTFQLSCSVDVKGS